MLSLTLAPPSNYDITIPDELAKERSRLTEAAKESRVELMQAIEKLQWCNTYEKSGVKCSVSPRSQHDEFRAMGSTTIRRPPSTVYSFIMDMKSRPAWDKLLNEHKIVDEFTRDANHRTVLWTMKFRPRYLKMKRRVTVLACYSGVHPTVAGGYMVSMMSVNTPMATVSDDEVACYIPVSGYSIVPHPSDPHHSTLVTYVIRIAIQNHLLGFMERTLMRTISQWAPPFAIIDRLVTLRGLVEERCMVSVVTTFPFMRESNFPPQFLRDFSYVKTDPLQSRDDVMRYYCGEDKESNWVTVTSERGLVMKKFNAPLLHDHHDVALKLSFTTSNFIQFALCLTDTDKRLIWEPCATRVEHIWDDGPMNICLKVNGGGPAKGRGCPSFDLFVYHIYSYGLLHGGGGGGGDRDIVDSCVYEEHSDGNILLVLLTSNNPGTDTKIDVFFFVNSDNYSDRSSTSMNFLSPSPSSPSSHLTPIERTLLESVIEFRNVIELDTWLPSESMEKLSLSDLAKSVTPQNRNSTELILPSPPSSQKRKQRLSPSAEEDRPLFGKMRAFFSLPPFSSVFNNSPHPPRPSPPAPSSSSPSSSSPSLSSSPTPSSPTIHLLFPSPVPTPSSPLTIVDLFSRLPYEILVLIFNFLPLESVLPCAQVCHRTWQVANLDIVWRDLMRKHGERAKETFEKWDKYIPPTYCSEASTSCHSPSSSLFDVQIPTTTTPTSVSENPNTDSLGSITMSSSRESSCGTIMLEDGVYTKREAMEMLLEEGNAEQRRKSLKLSLDTIEGYASPFKLEYLHGLAAEKCWKYGVSSYVPCGALSGDTITCLSEHEQDDTLLVACKSGAVRGISAADVASPSSRVLFTIATSDQPAIQAQWKGSNILAVFSNGELVEYDGITKEQKSRQFFTPMSGGFLYSPHNNTYHNKHSSFSSPSSSSPTLLVTHLREKLRVFNVDDDGSRALKWTSSRGEITRTRVTGTRCVAVTSMHALFTVNVIDMASSGHLLACLSGHQDTISQVRILDQSTGNLISSSSKDGTVRVWDLRAGTHVAKQYCHEGASVNCFYTDPDKLVAGLSTGEVAYWDPRYINKPVASFVLPATAKRENMNITNVHITRDHKRLVATWDTGLFSTWILHPR